MYPKQKFWRKKKSFSDEPHEQSRVRFLPTIDRNLQKVLEGIGIPDAAPFIPDEFQVDAIEKIKESDVLVSAPTGSGKTWIAVQAMKRILAEGKRAWYASPLKALSNSKYHEFSDEFGRENVGVLTGDRKENTDAAIVVGTTEILRNQLYDAMSKTADFKADLVVLDEAHYLGDRDRGVVWEEVMIYLPSRVRLLMLSATIQNDAEIASWLSAIRHHPCRVVHSDTRPVPIYPLYLLPDGEMLPLSDPEGITPKIEKYLESMPQVKFRRSQNIVPYNNILQALDTFNLLPAIFFLKSRSECNNALLACKSRVIPGEKARLIRDRFNELTADYPFLSRHPHLPYALNHGLCSHHGGQLPHWKIVIEKLMNEGYIDVIFSTSTVAAGVNFPARTVVLVQSDRFNGKEFVSLSASDLHQATGRAGRRGKDKIGFAVMVHGPFQDPHLIDELFSNKPDPIDSQIQINFSMVLNLLLSQTPGEIHALLNVSFATFQKIKPLRALEADKENIMSRLQSKLQGCLCENLSGILDRTEKRQLLAKQLSRTRKKRKNYIKACLKMEASAEADERLNELHQKIEHLSTELKNLPCERCNNFGLCYEGKKNHFLKLVSRAKQISESLDEARNVLWNDFCRHLDFLELSGFADNEGRLTADGIWASMLRLDQPLIIAELIRKGFFDDLPPALMSGIIAVFVSDKYRDIDVNPDMRWDKKPLAAEYINMTEATDTIMNLMKDHGFDVPKMQFWPAVALYVWAGGETWENVIRLTSVDEGDLAMMIFRTADNLRQIAALEKTHPGLAGKARKTIALLLREPVVIPV